MKQTAIVIAPGRGTYNKAELGYLRRHGAQAGLIATFNDKRRALGQPTLSALDRADRFDAAVHTRGDNASALIYACAYADFLSIDRDRFDIIGVTGNSMGWYIALSCAGALSPTGGFDVVNTMGALMQDAMIGGQLIYPYSDANWRGGAAERATVMQLADDIDERKDHTLRLSIDLGGLLVLAGDEAGLAAFESAAPKRDQRFPMRLPNHGAFHSALQVPVAKKGQIQLKQSLFSQPDLPLIDGRGGLWHSGSADLAALYEYTLGHQVTEPYDFAAAIRMAAQEFCPDVFIILGPGSTLSGAVAQSLIRCGWKGWKDKAGFQAAEKSEPSLIVMGG
ncbi:ACP S-malonyltransferase [Cognatishimia sp. SS12]|uniref:ACP S-malonyltransferase n=1 Tax=Cognatishimia sp. SS12 TaxID=2979465 RepID=UPI00232C1932|nr:ACP S-malonyltransferase [Cognatishimia sp. SS12]MDC0737639.1 ACP S-malonyltransferase [Cognatishimia sp. SS12]